MLLLAGQDLCTPRLDRLFVDPFASVGYVGEIEASINGNPDLPDHEAGANCASWAASAAPPIHIVAFGSPR